MGKPQAAGNRGSSKRAATKRIAQKAGFIIGSKEISAQHLIDMFHGKCDPRVISDRIKKVMNFHKNDKLHTYESFGLCHYVNKDGPKVNGELEHKRPDMRVVEVSLSGEEANAISYDIPSNPLQVTPHSELEIIKENWLPIEKLTEILEFVKSEKFATETLVIDFAEGVEEANQIKVRDVIQLLAGVHSAVSIAENKLKVKRFANGKDKRQQSWLWPKKFVSFVLQRNMRFPNVMEKAARRMGFNTHAIFQRTNFECGVGYVHQFVQVEKIEPELIREGFEKESCNVSNFDFTDAPIEKNKFRGFRFKFSIRKYKNTPEETKTILDNFKNNGYINYFNVVPSVLGRASITDVGKSLVKNDCMGAAKLIIRPRPVDRCDHEELKELTFISQDARVVAPLIRQRINLRDNNGLLARLFHTMLKDQQGKIGPKNVDAAFLKAKPGQIIEYTDLFLQFIWNETVNMLIEKRGLKLAAGDLVFVDEGKEQHILYESRFGPSIPKDQVKEGQESLKTYVNALSQEDVDSGEFSIFDLVIPVCGYDVQYPANDIGEYIDTVLKKHGFENKEWFEKTCKNQTTVIPVVFPGSYRKIVQEPENLKYEIREYVQEKVPLILDDVPRNLRKKSESNGKTEKMEVDESKPDAEATPAKKEEEAKEAEKKEEEKKKEDEKLEPQNGLIVEFFVPKGTSLMTPLRELFKKNDFGALASPFYERLVEPKRIEGFKKKLQQLQVALVERARAKPYGVRPLMGMGPLDMVPPMGAGYGAMRQAQVMPDQAMQRIQMLERELAAMRNERQQMRQSSFGSGVGISRDTFTENRDRFYEDRFDVGNGRNATSFESGRGGGVGAFDRDTASRGGGFRDSNPRSSFSNDSFNEQPLKRMRADFGRSDDDEMYNPFDRFNSSGGSGSRLGGNNLPSLLDNSPRNIGGFGGNRSQSSGSSFGNKPSYLNSNNSMGRGNNNRGRINPWN